MSQEKSEDIRPGTNTFIDKITMELLLNKTHYQKYLSKTDSKKHAEYQEYLRKLSKFHGSILGITESLLNNPKKTYTNEVGDAFDDYMHTLIKYLEIEEANRDFDQDEDALFPETISRAPEISERDINSFFHIPRSNK